MDMYSIIRYSTILDTFAIPFLYFVQLKLAETDKEALQEQLGSLHDAYTREVADLSERLEKYKRKYSDKKQQAVSKLNTSR